MIPSSLFTTAAPLPFRRECIRNELFIGARTHDAILTPPSLALPSPLLFTLLTPVWTRDRGWTGRVGKQDRKCRK